MINRWLSTGQLARRGGVNLQTVRYYERLGLIPVPPRTDSGHRRYAPEALSLLRLIRRAQELGFALREIRELMEGIERPSASCAQTCRAIDAKLDQIDTELGRLRARRQQLKRLRNSCPRVLPLRECPVIAELREEPRKGRRKR